ncbi:hypothetical protein [Azonexus sp.]|uniref:hypothetical protein n=1 Tax=Azonexus sp. TaxID=1872668 RepID=UPI0039E47776
MAKKLALLGALMFAIGVGAGGAIERERQLTENYSVKLPAGVSPEDVAVAMEIAHIKARGIMMGLSGAGDEVSK